MKALGLTVQDDSKHSNAVWMCLRDLESTKATSKTLMCSKPFENDDGRAIWLTRSTDKETEFHIHFTGNATSLRPPTSRHGLKCLQAIHEKQHSAIHNGSRSQRETGRSVSWPCWSPLIISISTVPVSTCALRSISQAKMAPALRSQKPKEDDNGKDALPANRPQSRPRKSKPTPPPPKSSGQDEETDTPEQMQTDQSPENPIATPAVRKTKQTKTARPTTRSTSAEKAVNTTELPSRPSSKSPKESGSGESKSNQPNRLRSVQTPDAEGHYTPNSPPIENFRTATPRHRSKRRSCPRAIRRHHRSRVFGSTVPSFAPTRHPRQRLAQRICHHETRNEEDASRQGPRSNVPPSLHATLSPRPTVT